MGNLEEAVAALAEKARLVYLEDLRGSVGLLDKAAGLVVSHMPRLFHDRDQAAPDVVHALPSHGRPMAAAHVLELSIDMVSGRRLVAV